MGTYAITWVRGVFGNAESKPKKIFTPEQLAKIYAEFDVIVKEESERLGLQINEAKTVRDALVARLAIANE